jgi:hypothetical protein
MPKGMTALRKQDDCGLPPFGDAASAAFFTTPWLPSFFLCRQAFLHHNSDYTQTQSKDDSTAPAVAAVVVILVHPCMHTSQSHAPSSSI